MYSIHRLRKWLTTEKLEYVSKGILFRIFKWTFKCVSERICKTSPPFSVCGYLAYFPFLMQKTGVISSFLVFLPLRWETIDLNSISAWFSEPNWVGSAGWHSRKSFLIRTILKFLLKGVTILLLLFMFRFFGLGFCGILAPQPSWTAHPLHWEVKCPTTGPPGKSPVRIQMLFVSCSCLLSLPQRWPAGCFCMH